MKSAIEGQLIQAKIYSVVAQADSALVTIEAIVDEGLSVNLNDDMVAEEEGVRTTD